MAGPWSLCCSLPPRWSGKDPGRTRGSGGSPGAAHRAIGIREKRRRGPSRDRCRMRRKEPVAMSAIVKDVMTTRVVAVKKNASFKEMAACLRQHRISAFPVIDDDGKVIGVVSEADLLTKEAL